MKAKRFPLLNVYTHAGPAYFNLEDIWIKLDSN